MANKEKFYRGSIFTTLGELEDRCATDETDGNPKALIGLELGTQNGKNGTIGTYEKSNDPNLGLLIFEEFEDDADANLLKTQHELNDEEELFRGMAQIGSDQKNVIVFRGQEE